ncbi:hypothetical protein KC867_00125 [Candidatus Saccharibacteria bacterium]|nr:hypothetical protein [Candidatus Saccharibacteria bacterium]
MGLFNRKRTNSSVLPELDQYYDGQKRDKTGLAWLLAAISVAIVVLFFIILFLAGKWAYRELTGANDNTGESSQVADSNSDESLSFDGLSTNNTTDSDNGDNADDTADADDTNSSQDGDTTSEDTSDQSTTDEELEPEGRVDAPASTTTPSGPNTPYVPITGDNEALPNTGAEGILALFIVASTIAGCTHYVLSTKNNRL